MLIVQTAVGGGGDAYSKAADKKGKKYKFFDDRAPFT
jgi:hypothetical protein